MPRPGPRPYECVKRAWHSDRHQPVRGSIIQQIFRLVTEAHCPATRKNKEWQEKLPVVVLKAEEIMYSKANSEEEYMNLETLLDRVNDAVDTIIRRDESTETGELLPPCVEAALNLGCIPVRASRSQRHSNPRTYLTPRIQEPASVPSGALNRSRNVSSSLQLPFHASSKLNYAASPADESRFQNAQNRNLVASRGYPFLCHNSNMESTQMARPQFNPPGSVYPLHYERADNQTEQFHWGSSVSRQPNAPPIILGMPIGVPVLDTNETSGFRSLSSHSHARVVSRETGQASLREYTEKPLEKACDLSLRLGLSSDSCPNLGKRSVSNEFCPRRNEEFGFVPGKRNIQGSDSFSTRLFSVSEDQSNVDGSFRKRRTMFRDSQ